MRFHGSCGEPVSWAGTKIVRDKYGRGRLTELPSTRLGEALSRRLGPNVAAHGGHHAVRVRPGRGLGSGQLPAGPLVQGDGRAAVGYDVEDRLETVSDSGVGGGLQERPGQAPAPDPGVDVEPGDATQLVGVRPVASRIRIGSLVTAGPAGSLR
jgi:hypothetical protein